MERELQKSVGESTCLKIKVHCHWVRRRVSSEELLPVPQAWVTLKTWPE